jgi:hypothetical protein
MGHCCGKNEDEGHHHRETHIVEHRPHHISKRPTHHVETHEGSSTHEEHHE